MGRKPKPCSQKCRKHTFALKPVHYSAYFSREISLSFCHDTLNPKSIIPKFNKDKNHYTSSFILQTDQCQQSKNQVVCKIEQEKSVNENSLTKLNIVKNDVIYQLVPKPRSRHNYCHVCKNNYQDYLHHIDSLSHKECIHSSYFNNSINQLCYELQLKNKPISIHYQSDSEIIQESKDTGSINQNDNKNLFTEPSKNLSEIKFFNDLIVPTKSFQYLSPELKNVRSSENPLKIVIPILKDNKEEYQLKNNVPKILGKNPSVQTDLPQKARIQRSIILNSNNMILID